MATHGMIDSSLASIESERMNERGEGRGRGVTDVLREYRGQPISSGLYEEDLEAIAENNLENVDSCDATEF